MPEDASAFAHLHGLFGDRLSTMTLDQFRCLNGAILRNAQTILPISPLQTFLLRMPQSELPRELQADPRWQWAYAHIDRLTRPGSGMFAVANCANHSCSPNIVPMNRHEDCTLSLVALRSVRAGEELFISYIDEHGPRNERREKLRTFYLFDCSCDRCSVEA